MQNESSRGSEKESDQPIEPGHEAEAEAVGGVDTRKSDAVGGPDDGAVDAVGGVDDIAIDTVGGSDGEDFDAVGGADVGDFDTVSDGGTVGEDDELRERDVNVERRMEKDTEGGRY